MRASDFSSRATASMYAPVTMADNVYGMIGVLRHRLWKAVIILHDKVTLAVIFSIKSTKVWIGASWVEQTLPDFGIH